MPQDAFTLEYLAKDLDALLAGGKVNKITQPDGSEFYMNIYAARKNYKVVVSSSVAFARVCTADDSRENPATAFNFCMLLRKHLLGATLLKVELDGFDRVIKMTFAAQDDFFATEEKVLYAEIMGKYSNAILTAGGKILGALKTAGIEEAAKRPLLAGLPYLPPPAQDKLSLDDPALDKALENAAGTAGEKIFALVKGVSYQTAQEIAQVAGGDAAALRKFLKDGEYAPCVGFADGKPTDFFVRPYRSQPLNYKFFPTLVAAEEFFYGEKERAGRFRELQSRLAACVGKEEKKYRRRLQIIGEKQLDCKDYESDRIKGELILANLYAMKKGDEQLVAENYYGGGRIKISLDKTLTPQENAQRYFKKYNKQKRTLAAVNPQKTEAESELEYILSLSEAIARAADRDELLAVEEELAAQGLIGKNAAAKKIKPAKFLVYSIDGYTVKVGRNNMENDALVSSARGRDTWLHARAYHSSHVVIEGDAPPKNVMLIAAEICAYFSAGRNGSKIDVDYTLKRFVRKPRGAKPGFVTYTDHSTLTVNPAKHEEFLKSI